MNDGLLVAIGAAIGVIIREFLTGATKLLDSYNKSSAERRAANFSEQSVIIDRQEKQIARLEAQIKEQQAAIEEIRDAHTDCREESAELRMYLSMLREDMIQAGLKPRDLPPSRHQHVDSDFVARTQATNVKLSEAADALVVTKKPEAS